MRLISSNKHEIVNLRSSGDKDIGITDKLSFTIQLTVNFSSLDYDFIRQWQD